MSFLKSTFCILVIICIFPIKGNGQSKGRVLAEDQMIFDFAFTPDGGDVILAVDNRLEKWNINQHSRLLKTENIHQDNIVALDFIQKDSKELTVTAAKDQRVIVWEMTSGEPLHQIELDNTDPIDVTFLPGDRQIAIATSSSGVLLWDFSNDKLEPMISTPDAHVLSLDIHHENNFLAASTSDGSILLWDLKNNQLLTVLTAKGAWLTSVRFAQDSDILMATDNVGHLYSWKITEPFNFISKSSNGNSFLSSLAVHPEGKMFTTGSHNKKVYVHVQGKQLRKKLKGFITHVDFRPGNQVFVEIGVSFYGKGFEVISLADFKY